MDPLRCARCGYDLSGVETAPLGHCVCPECGASGSIAEIGRAPRPPWPSRRNLIGRWFGAPLGIGMLSLPLAAASWGAALGAITLAAGVGVMLPLVMAPDMGVLHWGSRTKGVLLAAAVLTINITLLALIGMLARAVAVAMR